MNELTDEKRYKLKIRLILIVVLFLTTYGTMMFLKYTKQTQSATSKSEENHVILEQQTLTFFNYKIKMNGYPDRINIHYPYLLVVRPNELRSEIYNMETKRKEKEVKEVLLDYFDGDSVYNKNGYITYFNTTNLRVLCDLALIKTKDEVFCVTRPDQSKQENKLISINTQTLQQSNIYTSQNVITAVSIIKNTIYIGDYDFLTNKAFITSNNLTIPADDLINNIYPINNTTYLASFKSLRNKQKESLYELKVAQEESSVQLIKQGKIIYY